MTSPPGLSYMPQPFEQPYYSGLFNAADTERTGSISGAAAVQFLGRSKLPVDVLKMIWTASDIPATNSLDHRKFAVAVRLIQLIQNGQKGQGPNLSEPTGVTLRPAFFDGVSGVSVPLPQQQQENHPQPPHQQNQQQPLPTVSPLRQQSSTPSLAPSSPSLQSIQGSVPQNSRAYQPPNTPPLGPHQAAVGGGALAVQDPYSLTPSEQARYEQLFGDYSREDGYCYGSEAVTLFGKSGVPQMQLAAIWNMVDYGPVDNRLDKLEFAMAMHLIVCVSKKNLPLPPSLPMALKQLKAQQQAASQATSAGISSIPQAATQPQLQQAGPNNGGFLGGSRNITPGSINDVSTDGFRVGGVSDRIGGFSSQQVGSVPPMVGSQPVASSAAGFSAGMAVAQGPPPLEPPSGGQSISDAFEGLMSGGSAETVSTYTAASPNIQPSTSIESNNGIGMDAPKSTMMHDAPPEPSVVSSNPPVSIAKTSSTPKRKTNLSGGSSLDLDELREALQKLQAENISLKARLGTISEEEEDVRKELTKTVSEITKLSTELTTLRASVLNAKSRLLEVTGELSAAKEKKSVISDLITEARSTKSAIEEATYSIEKASEASKLSVAPAPSFEGDLFDWGGGDVLESAPAPSQQPLPSQTYSASVDERPSTYAPVPPAIKSNQINSASSNDTSNNYSAYSQSLPEPNERTAVESLAEPQIKSIQPEPPRMHNYPPEPAAMFSYGSSEPSQTYKKPDLQRDMSLGFGEVMGGGSDLRSMTSGSMDAPTASSGGYEDMAELKRQAEAAKKALREAENVARDAQESKEQMQAHAEELRRVADEAESAARQMSSSATGKKKGLFGRGQQKHDVKEAEKLAMEAQDKKDAFLQAQSQVNDATALAKETRKELERLRKAAEDLDIKVASAASMQPQQPPNQPQQPPKANGFTSIQAPSYGFGTMPTPSRQPDNIGGFGSQPYGMGSGFNTNVMGSGGESIPTPSGAEDPYSNPFG